MVDSTYVRPHISTSKVKVWLRTVSTRSWFVGAASLLFVLISLVAGNIAYLSIALLILSVNVLLLLIGGAFSSGIFWILGFSTVTGLFQRLILYRTGQSPSPDYIRLALELCILLYFSFAFIKYLKDRKGKVPTRFRQLDILVTIYLVLSSLYALNIFYVEDLIITLYGWRWVCIPIFFYYIGRLVGTTQSMLTSVNHYLVVLLLLQAGYGAYQAIVGYPFYDQPWIAQNAARQTQMGVEDSLFIAGMARIPAFTEAHIVVSFLIPMVFLWLLYLPGGTFSPRWRFLRHLALLFSILYLIFARERSALGMVIVGIAVVTVVKYRRQLGRGIFLAVIPVLILWVWLVNLVDPAQIPWSEDTIVFRRFLELLNPLRSGTFAGRVNVYWPVYFQYFFSNPFGYGLGSFHATSATQLSVWGKSPHNMYIQVLLETGFVGLLNFMAVLSAFFFSLYTLGRKHLPYLYKGIVYGSLASFVSFLAIGMANQPIETFPLAIHFWFLIGLTTSTLTTTHKAERHNA